MVSPLARPACAAQDEKPACSSGAAGQMAALAVWWLLLPRGHRPGSSLCAWALPAHCSYPEDGPTLLRERAHVACPAASIAAIQQLKGNVMGWEECPHQCGCSRRKVRAEKEGTQGHWLSAGAARLGTIGEAETRHTNSGLRPATQIYRVPGIVSSLRRTQTALATLDQRPHATAAAASAAVARSC